MNPTQYEATSARSASRRLARAIALLSRAGKQLDEASRTAPDRYHANRLRFVATGLRNVTIPLYRILEKGGGEQ